MKTFDKKDIFTCVTAEEAIAYIDNTGYFADALSGFNHIDCFVPYSLDEVQIGTDKPFVSRAKSYALFLPTDKVKEVKDPKKWRPFKDIGEFQNTTNKFIGDILEIKMPSWSDEPFRALILWATQNNLGIASVTRSSFNDLFQILELKNYKNEWQPFGVLEND